MPALFPEFLGDPSFVPLGMDEHVVNLLGHLVRAEEAVHADEADDVSLDIGVDFSGKELVVQMRVVFFGIDAVLGDFLLSVRYFAALLLEVVRHLVGNRFHSRTRIQEGFDTVQYVKCHPVAILLAFALDVHRRLVVEHVAPLKPDYVKMPVHPVLKVLQVVTLGQHDDFREELLLYHVVSLYAICSLYHFPCQPPPVATGSPILLYFLHETYQQ